MEENKMTDAEKALNYFQRQAHSWRNYEEEKFYKIAIAAIKAQEKPVEVTREEFKRQVNLYIDMNYPVAFPDAVMKAFPNGVKVIEGGEHE